MRNLICSLLTTLLLAAGCATTPTVENQLTAAGFRVVPATTPPQLQHMQTLPDHKITVAQRKGRTFFVYPDKAGKILYVGGQKQYENYQQLRMQNQIATQNMEIAAMDRQTAEIDSWNNWGMWGPGWGWGGNYDTLPPY